MDRAATIRFINENFGGIIQDWPWPDSPEYTVFRHADNKKWFALIMNLPAQTLARQNPHYFANQPALGDSTLDVINLKCDLDIVETVIHEPGILPAYHMNKRHWITVLLDGSCPSDRLRALISFSYRLTAAHSSKDLQSVV